MPLIASRDADARSGAWRLMSALRATDARLALHGTTVVVTRAADRADHLAAPLQALGASVTHYAATRIVPREVDAVREAARCLARYDWVVFTSATAVNLLFDAAEACGVLVADWSHTRIAAVGSATAQAVQSRGATPTLVPDRFVAEGLVEAFAARSDVRDARVLYPAATGARAELPDGLRALGAQVDRIDAYESVATDDDVCDVSRALRDGRVQIVTLTSRSAVDAWVTAMTPLHAAAEVVSIGPVTTEAARAAGLRVAAEAMPSTVDGLVAAVVRAVQSQRDRQQHLTTNS
jgi:uroporphyrinogen-III synthase